MKASNDIFGDSCWGQLKYLETAYKCRGKLLRIKNSLLPPAKEVWAKVIFSQAAVILSTGGGGLPDRDPLLDRDPLWMEIPRTETSHRCHRSMLIPHIPHMKGKTFLYFDYLIEKNNVKSFDFPLCFIQLLLT